MNFLRRVPKAFGGRGDAITQGANPIAGGGHAQLQGMAFPGLVMALPVKPCRKDERHG
jgi:hypothetical protein